MDVTPNHKFFTTDGRNVEAKDLVKGDSLPMFKKCKNGKDDYIVVTQGKHRLTEHRMIKAFYEPEKFNKQIKEGVYHGCCKTDNVVVHHKDENKHNNNPDNLEITTASEHSAHHGEDLVGNKNPMFGRKQSDKTRELIGQRAKERCSDPDYVAKMKASFRDEGREKLSTKMTQQKKDWDLKYANEIEQKANDAGLRTIRISETQVRIIRNCEFCDKEFLTYWNRRGQPYCSQSCGNTKAESIENRRIGNRKTKDAKAKEVFHNQVMIYKDLQEKLENVEKKDWENACREQKVSFRFQTSTPNPWICKNWGDFKKRADDYNHRVSHIEELDGEHTVYNITVEDNHTLAVVTKSNDEKTNLQAVVTFNCAEISLSNKETCCLGELYLPNIKTKEELFTCTRYIYRICKHSLTLPCTFSKETEDVVHKNMRIGIGVTGYLQSSEEQKQWLPDCYEMLREYDMKYSAQHNFPQSVKLTTCKPSGTLSLLAGVTAGVHPGYAEHYIRRVRISSESPLVQIAIKHGYHVEYARRFDGTNDTTTQIISFPYSLPKHTVFANECTAIQQLEYVRRLQTDWSDNSVSVTVTYKKEELPAIKEWLKENYNDTVKTVSFLLYSGHGFDQAPIEPITKEQYQEMKKKCKPFTSLEGICYVESDQQFIGEGECAGGACPIK
jgi:intein/homing endonuclease